MSRPEDLKIPLSDLITCIILWAVFIYCDSWSPTIRHIQPEEMWRYSKPTIVQQQVSSVQLWLVAILLPVAALTVVGQGGVHMTRGLTALILLLGYTGLATMVLKCAVGRPRPDFLSRCQPLGGDAASYYANGGDAGCLGNVANVLEGRRSFPSGHASIATASMVFTSLVLARELRVWSDNRGSAWRISVCLLPLLLAAYIGASRVVDNRHHWEDVFVGGLIGTALAKLCHSQYFFD